MKPKIGTIACLIVLVALVLCAPVLAEEHSTAASSKASDTKTFAKEADDNKSSVKTPEKDPRECMTGILYGEGHVYKLKAPKGWVLDNQVAVDAGLHAVFYPVGGSWSDSLAVMYTRVQERDGRSVQEMIDTDVKHMGQDASGFKSTSEPEITTEDGKKSATVRHLSGDKFNSYEAVAYFEEPKLIALVILSARNKEAFDEALPAFKELTKSYSWISDKVKIEDMTTK